MHSLETLSVNKIKEISKLHQKKYREQSGLFIAEGLKSVQELIDEKIEIKYIFALKSVNKTKLNFSVTFIDEAAMKKISTTNSVCEILAVARKKEYSKKEIQNRKKIILLDSISDPGNLGTIIRSASAFGVDAIILYNNCVDLYSSKVIRSSAGNFFKTPVLHIKNTEELNTLFPQHVKISTLLSEVNNISIKDCSKLDKYIIMFGSEADGLCDELTNTAQKNIKLKMKNNVESLNLSVSVSIILYELSL